MCCGQVSAASTRLQTSAESRSGGWKRLRRSRRRKTSSDSSPSGSNEPKRWKDGDMGDQHAARTRPLTGDEYLESLRDGREIWIYGERVKDVTTHPAFRNTARMLARLYDALHDAARKDVLTAPTDTGNDSFTHPFYKAPRSMEDLVASRDA